METLVAILAGALFALGTYLLLRRHLLRMIFGLLLLTNGANLLLFVMGRLTREGAPQIPTGEVVPVGPVSDPVAQALILTAIVINLGVTGFMLLLVYRTEQLTSSSDIDELRQADASPSERETSL